MDAIKPRTFGFALVLIENMDRMNDLCAGPDTAVRGHETLPPRGKTPAAGSLVVGFLLLCVGSTQATGSDTGPLPPEEPRSGWYPAAGVVWATPRGDLHDLYDGGPGFFVGMGYTWPRRFRAEVRLDWFRSSADPEPILADAAESRLTLAPLTAEFHVRAGGERLRPYVLAGPAVVFSEETFTYQLGSTTTRIQGRRTDFGGVFGAGVEGARGRINARLAARVILAAGDREILRSGGRTDEGSGRVHPSIWTISLELQLR